MSEDEEDIDDILKDDVFSSSWQPLSMTALAFLFMVFMVSCSRSGSMLVV